MVAVSKSESDNSQPIMVMPVLANLDGLSIGPELARQLIRYSIVHVKPFVEFLESWVQEQVALPLTRSPQSVAQVAQVKADGSPICMGVVFTGGSAQFAVATINVLRDGSFTSTMSRPEKGKEPRIYHATYDPREGQIRMWPVINDGGSG